MTARGVEGVEGVEVRGQDLAQHAVLGRDVLCLRLRLGLGFRLRSMKVTVRVCVRIS